MHPLAVAYQNAVHDLPDALRVRSALEDEVAKALTGGDHALIRGFWRIGKTELCKAALKKACERTGGAAFYIDLRDPEQEDGLPKTQDSVLARLKAKVDTFIERVGAGSLKADPKHPLLALGELAAPIFVGIDEAIALKALGQPAMSSMLDDLLQTPKNVKLCLVCHRHREADELFESLSQRPHTQTFFVPNITDEELAHLVRTPAREHGVTVNDELLAALNQVSGRRPWEVFVLCYLITRGLDDGFKGELKSDLIDPWLSVDALTEVEEGQAVVDNVLRVLTTAMNDNEQAVVTLLATGGEGEVPEDALESLQKSAYLENKDGFVLLGSLFEGLARAVAEGEIRVRVE